MRGELMLSHELIRIVPNISCLHPRKFSPGNTYKAERTQRDVHHPVLATSALDMFFFCYSIKTFFHLTLVNLPSSNEYILKRTQLCLVMERRKIFDVVKLPEQKSIHESARMYSAFVFSKMKGYSFG